MDNTPQWVLDMNLEVEVPQAEVARDLGYEKAIAPSLREHKATQEREANKPTLIKRYSDGDFKKATVGGKR
jgi:hypothetical protein